LSAVQSVAKELGENLGSDYKTSLKELAVALAYTCLYLWGSFWLLKGRDL
jgi:hypothetical protein